MKTLKKLFYCLLMFGLLLAISSSASAQTVETKSLTLAAAVLTVSISGEELAPLKS